MFKYRWAGVIIGVIITAFVSQSISHSGRTDASGGHNNRKTGGYHYHNKKTYSPPVQLEEKPVQPQRRLIKSSVPRQSKPIPAPTKSNLVSITENHWQVALNNKVYQGNLEVTAGNGRADISTETYIIEVDKASKYNEGIAQVLRYAKATGKNPILALYVDGEKGGFNHLKQAERLCLEKGIQFLFINEYISVNDINSLINPDYSVDSTGAVYWINTKSNVRHNKSCRWYRNTTNGRASRNREGRACKTCGG